MKNLVSIFKIKSGKLDKWKNWCEQLEINFAVEVRETLIEEKVIEELFQLIEIDGKHYAVGFSKGEMLPANMSREINKKHTEMKKECLEFVGNGEALYHFLNS